MARGWRDKAERASNPNQLKKADFAEALKYFKFKCAYCGKSIFEGKLTKDHVLAISKNGLNTKSNVIPACTTCNISKGAKPVYDWYKKQEFFNKNKMAKIDVWRILNQKEKESI